RETVSYTPPRLRTPVAIIITTLSLYLYMLFFFNDTATTEIYTLSLHDALPIYEWEAFKKVISRRNIRRRITIPLTLSNIVMRLRDRKSGSAGMPRPISYAVFCLKKKTITNRNSLTHSNTKSYKNIHTHRHYESQ